MRIRGRFFNTVALTLSVGALAGLMGTEAYSQAAGAEARGLKALLMLVEANCYECPERSAERWTIALTGDKK